MTATSDPVSSHYANGGLAERILAALEQSGKKLEQLTVADLAPVDQFHTRGLAATHDLIAFAAIKAGSRVLDVGSGLGGPARLAAAERDCHVTGIDLTKEFCEVATLLSKLTGLEHATEFRHGDATALPFADGEFDLAFTIQIQMNIADKPRFYGEVFRALKPGGRFAFQDILAGPGGEIHLPVPWAASRETSFLVPVEELRELLRQAGFRLEVLEDISDEALAWRKNNPAAAGLAASTLGMHVVMGERYALMQANQVKNLEQKCIRVVRGLCSKPGRA
jgi:MPBQ/MSBQ methyltransferase